MSIIFKENKMEEAIKALAIGTGLYGYIKPRADSLGGFSLRK